MGRHASLVRALRAVARPVPAASRSSALLGRDARQAGTAPLVALTGWRDEGHRWHQGREVSGWAFWGSSASKQRPEAGREQEESWEELPGSRALAGGMQGEGESAAADAASVGSPAGALAAEAAATASAAAAGSEPGQLVGGAAWLMEAVQSSTGLPWWSTLMLMGVGVRVSLLPLAVQQGVTIQRSMQLWTQAKAEASTAMIRSQAEERMAGGGEGRGLSSSEPPFREVWGRFQALLREKGGTLGLFWIPAVPLLSVATIATNAFAIRHLAQKPSSGLAEGGALWFPDLTQAAMHLAENAAPMGLTGGLLPVLVVSAYLTNINRLFGTTAQPSLSPASQQAAVVAWIVPHVRLLLEWLCVALLWGFLQQPQALLLYLLSSASVGLVQHSVYGQTAIRAATVSLRDAIPAAALSNSKDDPSSLADPTALSDFAKAMFSDAAHRQANNDIKGAVEALHRLAAAEPKQPRPYFALGKVYSKLKQWNAAEAAFLRSAELEKPGEQQGMAFHYAGIALFQQGEVETAVDALKKASRLRPGDPEVWMSLGSALSADGKAEEARRAFTTAGELDPAVREHLQAGLLKDVHLQEERRREASSEE
mmetsp:Transcript_18863/g.52619  ORF Transcript_18863/g.52619 Transcript_18863/m.52619 type:complete len:597 (+) Transcript_18863:130-1920(+)